MDGRREGRRVREVHHVEVLDAHLLVERRDHDVHDLVDRAGAEHLHAEQPVCLAARHELDEEARGAGVVVRLVIHDGDDALGIEALLAGRRLGEAGAPGVQRGQQADDAGAEHARIARGRSVSVRASARPAMLAVDPMGLQAGLPVMALRTMAQSPAA